MLNVYGHMRAPSHHPTRGNVAVSAQAALFLAAARKLLSASCCTHMARHLSSSCSVHVALCKFLSARRSVLVSVRKMLRLSVCASGLRFSGRSRQEYTPHTTASFLEPELQSNPRPRDCESRARKPRDNFQWILREYYKMHGATSRALQHAQSLQKVRHGSPRLKRIRIPAEGSSAPRKKTQKQKKLEFLHLDHADPRRSSRGQIRNRKKTRVFVPQPHRSLQTVVRADQTFFKKKTRVFASRPRRSRQRVARADQKSKKTSSFASRPRRIPQRVARDQKSKKTSSFCISTTPQRVARADQKSTKTSSFCISTTPIPAKGCAGSEIKKHPTTPIPAEGSSAKTPKNPEVFAPRPLRSQRAA